MFIHDAINRAAMEIAEQKHASVAYLEREIVDLEANLKKKRTERDQGRGALQRLSNFPVKVGADYLCPYCWVVEGKRSPIHPIGSNLPRTDIMRCTVCQFDLQI